MNLLIMQFPPISRHFVSLLQSTRREIHLGDPGVDGRIILIGFIEIRF
jgi:hypothetical protein